MEALSLWAGNVYCVRSNATGNNDGSDWTNAWDDLPASLTRGDTYYIADGNYGGHVFNDAVDGTKYITIKKAIESDHGTNTGWQTSYGDDTADFVMEDPTWYLGQYPEHIRFLTSYYIFDGQVGGGPGNWGSGHGFRIVVGEPINISSGYYQLIVLGSWTEADDSDYIEFRHIEFISPYREPYDDEIAIYGLPNENDNDVGALHVILSHCYFHDIHHFIQVKQGRYWTIEYNYFARNNGGEPGTSQEGQSSGICDFGSDDVIVRYNIFEDIMGTAFIALKSGISGIPFTSNNWEIYGNVFYYTPDYNRTVGGNGIIGDTGLEGGPTGYTSNIKIYNNAFVDLRGDNIGIFFAAPLSTNNKVYNNIWYNCTSKAQWDFFTGIDDHGYNWYGDVVIAGWGNVDSTLATAEIGGQDGSEDPFVDWQAMNFNLSAATDAGLDLGFPYDYDMFGNIRGADGTWDRGAYEYGASSVEPEPEPEPEEKPDKTELRCYNNVFNPTKGEKALIVVELPEQAQIKISLYDIKGNKINELADEEKEAGTHKYYWDGRNGSGNVVGSGLYFVHIQAGDYKKTKKIVVIK